MSDRQMCPFCKCCEVMSEPCEQCGGDGVFGHDCGEDTCCCLEPEENEDCELCFGLGYFKMCIGGCDGQTIHGGRKDS